MQRLNSISHTAASRAATLAGAALIADGVLQLLHSQKHAGSRVVGLAGNLNLMFVAIALAAMAPCLVVLGRLGRSRAAETAGAVAAAGTCLLAVGCLTSIVNQHDLAVFPAIAGLANLAWFGGVVTIGVSLVRGGRVRPPIALGLPATWICAIPLATIGGCALAGAYFLTVAYLLVTHRLEGRGGRRLAVAAERYERS